MEESLKELQNDGVLMKKTRKGNPQEGQICGDSPKGSFSVFLDSE